MTELSRLNAVSTPLALIRANEGFQPRFGGIEERHVRLLMASDPDTWPPLMVTPNDTGGYDVIDGFHRLEAACRMGLTMLPCIVDVHAGYPTAVSANLHHGLPLRLSDRRLCVRWQAEADPALSLREIGRRCGLNHETVKRALEPESRSADAEAGENRQTSRTTSNPVPDLVQRTVQAYQQGWGRTWLGLGKAGNPAPFRQALEAYADEHRGTVARALNAYGRACVHAAAPYLADGD